MAKDFKVRAILEAEDRASGAVSGFRGKLGNLSRSLKVGFVAAAAAATAAAATFVSALRSSVAAAQVQEDAVNKLNAALAPLGASSKSVSKALQEQAAALQKTTKFGDETIIAGQALVASFNRNEEVIKSATVAALELASVTGQSLQSAFLLMGRAAAGETSTLSRYGIILDEGIPKSERFAAAVAKINEQFGGQAAAQADTFTGALAQISNAFGDLQEVAGDSIIKNDEIRESLQAIRDLLQSEGLIAAVEILSQRFVEMGTALLGIPANATAEDIAELGEKIEDFARAVTGVIDILNAAQNAVATFASLLMGDYQGAIRNSQEATAAFKDGLAGLKGEMTAEEFKGEILKEFKKNADAAAAAANKLTAAEEKRLALETQLAASSKAFAENIKALGVTLETETNAAIEKNNALLDEATVRYRERKISLQELEAIENAIAIENAKLTGTYEDQTTAVNATTEGVNALTAANEANAVAAGLLAERTRDAANEVRNLGLETQRTASQSQPQFSENLLGGTSDFATISGGTFTTIRSRTTTGPDGRVQELV